MKRCLDEYNESFTDLSAMFRYFNRQQTHSKWQTCPVPKLRLEPLDTETPANRADYAPDVSDDAIKDTAKGIGLAGFVTDPATNTQVLYPIRKTAYKSMLDRAKLNGTVLPKLSRKTVARTLNECMRVHTKSTALLLVRDEKICAFHSGKDGDYSILPTIELMDTMKEKMDERFPGFEFVGGYTDHATTVAEFTFPGQREALLKDYEQALTLERQKKKVAQVVPGIFFTTSDTGVEKARICARLTGLDYPVPIGRVLEVKHEGHCKISDFGTNMDMVFGKFKDTIEALKSLLNINISNPINVMKRMCKKLSVPRVPGREAIAMFEMTNGNDATTAHEIYYALQEVLYNMKVAKCSPSKIFEVEETLTGALSATWTNLDHPGKVDF